MNPLYLIIHSVTGYFKEKYDGQYLILDSAKEYKEVFFGIKSEIEIIYDGNELFYEKKIKLELELIPTMIYL